LFSPQWRCFFAKTKILAIVPNGRFILFLFDYVAVSSFRIFDPIWKNGFDINILLTTRRKGAKRKHRQAGNKSLSKNFLCKLILWQRWVSGKNKCPEAYYNIIPNKLYFERLFYYVKECYHLFPWFPQCCVYKQFHILES